MALCLSGCGSGSVAGSGTGWRKTKTVVLCEHMHYDYEEKHWFVVGVCSGCEPYYVSYEYNSDSKDYTRERNEEAYITKMNEKRWFVVAHSEVEVPCDTGSGTTGGYHVHHLITFAKN